MRTRSSRGGRRGFLGNVHHLHRLEEALEERPHHRSWKQWRKANPNIKPDLRGLSLSHLGSKGESLPAIDLSAARLSGATLWQLRGWQMRLAGTDLRGANLDGADISYADLRGANLESCRLVQTNLTLIRAQGAKFRNANLSHAIMNGASLQGADLSGARVAGLSTWDVKVDETTRQKAMVLESVGDFLEDLVDEGDRGKKPIVGHVDDIEAVQLVYLLREKFKFPTVINALTGRVVLILGNFSARRRAVLHALERALAAMGYAPVVFDFAPPEDRDLIETVALLAGLSCFVVADLTRPRSTPLEAMLVVPNLRVPFATIIEAGEIRFAMFRALETKYRWVLPTWTYPSREALVRQLNRRIVQPCEDMRRELRKERQSQKR